ncbi:MAG TPA: hypothetical protein ENI12_04020 [Nitrospirae bacterium]|nr:hypothetical protein [Nitrospirota bacterium]
MKRFKAVLAVVFVLAMMGILVTAVAVPFADANPGGLGGKVIETMDSGGYTYVQIEKDGQNVWFAVPATSVKVGEQVAFQPGPVMQNFKSKSLGRTFEVIIFSGGIIR